MPAVPPVALLLAGGLPLLVAGAIAREDASWWLDRRVRGLGVLCGGLSSGRLLRDRLRWAVPQLLRAIEYGAIIWIAVAPRATTPTRPRSRCSPRSPSATTTSPTASRSAADAAARRSASCSAAGTGGCSLTTALGAAGAAAAGFYLLAAAIAALAVGEAVAFWLRGDQTSLDFGDGGD